MSEYGEQQATFFVEGLEELDVFIAKLREIDNDDETFVDEDPQDVIDKIMHEEREVFDPETDSHYSLTQPLSVDEVREFSVVICTGGPAVKIVAKYWTDSSEAFYVALQHQDWFEGWADYDLNSKQQALVEEYVRHFVYIE